MNTHKINVFPRVRAVFERRALTLLVLGICTVAGELNQRIKSDLKSLVLQICFSISLVGGLCAAAQTWAVLERSSAPLGCSEPHISLGSSAAPAAPLLVCLLLRDGAQLISLMVRVPVRKHKKGLNPSPSFRKAFPCCGKKVHDSDGEESWGICTLGQSSSLQTWTWGSHQIPHLTSCLRWT